MVICVEKFSFYPTHTHTMRPMIGFAKLRFFFDSHKLFIQKERKNEKKRAF